MRQSAAPDEPAHPDLSGTVCQGPPASLAAPPEAAEKG